MRHIITALLLLIVAAATAAAQPAPARFVRGFGGISFVSEPGGVFGGTIGIRVSDTLQVIGDAGRLTNIMPRAIQRDLDAVARQVGSFYGAPLTIDGRAPGVYAFGGLRVSRAVTPRMRVFLEGGVGAARGTSDITARAGTADVSRDVTAMLRIKRSVTEPLLAIGGGVAIPLKGRLTADLGYRFMRIFTEDPRIDTGTMTAGFGWSF